MKIKTIELYEYSELPKKIQETVLEKNRYINVEDVEWWDYDGKTGFNTKELGRMRLDPYSPDSDELLTWKEFYFDLVSSRYVQFKDASFKNDEVARRFLGVPKQIWENTTWDIDNNRLGSTYLSWEYGNGFLTDRVEVILNKAVKRFSDKMAEVLKDLQSTYDSLIEDEAIVDTIEANEYTFTKDGKMES